MNGLLKYIEGEYRAALEKIGSLAEEGCECPFSIMEYRSFKPAKMLLDIQLDEETAFTVRLTSDKCAGLMPNESIVAFFNRLSKSSTVEGGMSMRESIRDAAPAHTSLSEFFAPHPLSKYKDNPPVGLHAGKVRFIRVEDADISFDVEDLNRVEDITGSYLLQSSKSYRIDPWGSLSKILFLKSRYYYTL